MEKTGNTHSFNTAALIAVLTISILSIVMPDSQPAYAHTLSPSETTQFLSHIYQAQIESKLVITNVVGQNSNRTIAQAHANTTASLLNETLLCEIREESEGIADSIKDKLMSLRGNVTTSSINSQDIDNINRTVSSLNDTLQEAITVKVDAEQLDNATVWALVTGSLVDATLFNYREAIDAPIDLTGPPGIGEEMQQYLNNSGNMPYTNSSIAAFNDTVDIYDNTIGNNKQDHNMTIHDPAPYQSALQLANRTLDVFTEKLQPLTTSAARFNLTLQESGKLEDLHESLFQLQVAIKNKAAPEKTEIIAHTDIHPLLTDIYGLDDKSS